METLLDQLESSVPSPRCLKPSYLTDGGEGGRSFCEVDAVLCFQSSGLPRRSGLARPAAGEDVGFLRHQRAGRADGVFVGL